MAHRGDGLNDIFEHDVLIRETCKANLFSGNCNTPTEDLNLANKKYVDDSSGGGSDTWDDVIQRGNISQKEAVIDVTNTEAFLVRKDSDGGDIFVVDTTNENVNINGIINVNSDYTGNVIDIQNNKNTGWSAIDFFDLNGTTMGSVGYGNTEASTHANKTYFGSIGDIEVSINSNDTERINILGTGEITAHKRLTIDASSLSGSSPLSDSSLQIHDGTPDIWNHVIGFFPNYSNSKAMIVLGNTTREGGFDLYNYRAIEGEDTYKLKFTTKGTGAEAIERIMLEGNSDEANILFSNSKVGISGVPSGRLEVVDNGFSGNDILSIHIDDTNTTNIHLFNDTISTTLGTTLSVDNDGHGRMINTIQDKNLMFITKNISGYNNNQFILNSDGNISSSGTLSIGGNIELGNATDTTLSRSGAGVLAVEGKNVYMAGGTDVAVADGGTNLSSYTQGDILYASAGTTLTKLAKNTNATRYLSNRGGSNNPAWTTINLTNGAEGTLGVLYGGTGRTNLTPYGLAVGASTSTAYFFITPPATAGAMVYSPSATDYPTWATGVLWNNAGNYLHLNSDNGAVVFGAGADSSLSYSGTNTILKNLVGSGQFNVQMDLLIGSEEADKDYKITFNGETNKGVLRWLEDEDYFEFENEAILKTTNKLYFNDTSSYIQDDGTDLILESSGDIKTSKSFYGNFKSSDGSAGIDQIIAILDGNGTTTHNLTFKDGLLTAYSTS